MRTARHAGRHVQLRFAFGHEAQVALGISHGDRLLISLGFPSKYAASKTHLVRFEKANIGHVVGLRSINAGHLEVAIYANRWGLSTIKAGLFASLSDWHRVIPTVIEASLPPWATPIRESIG